MPADQDHGPIPTSMIVSCRLPHEQAQRLFEQADAAGLGHSEHVRALLVEAMVAVERAVEATRRETDRVTQVERDQEVEALRAELDQAYELCLAWKRQALKSEEDIVFAGRDVLVAVEGVLNVLPGYRGRVLHGWAGLSPDDRLAVLPHITARIGEWLEDIGERTSTVRSDIFRDRKSLRGVRWLLAELGSEVGSSDARDAPPMPEWRSVAIALDAAEKAIEKRDELAGDSR